MNLTVVVIALRLNYLTKSAHVMIEDGTHTVYDVAFEDLEEFSTMYDNVFAVSTSALKPSDYYLNKQVDAEVKKFLTSI